MRNSPIGPRPALQGETGVSGSDGSPVADSGSMLKRGTRMSPSQGAPTYPLEKEVRGKRRCWWRPCRFSVGFGVCDVGKHQPTSTGGCSTPSLTFDSSFLFRRVRWSLPSGYGDHGTIPTRFGIQMYDGPSRLRLGISGSVVIPSRRYASGSGMAWLRSRGEFHRTR